jgi:hypothetical protein
VMLYSSEAFSYPFVCGTKCPIFALSTNIRISPVWLQPLLLLLLPYLCSLFCKKAIQLRIFSFVVQQWHRISHNSLNLRDVRCTNEIGSVVTGSPDIHALSIAAARLGELYRSNSTAPRFGASGSAYSTGKYSARCATGVTVIELYLSRMKMDLPTSADATDSTLAIWPGRTLGVHSSARTESYKMFCARPRSCARVVCGYCVNTFCMNMGSA